MPLQTPLPLFLLEKNLNERERERERETTVDFISSLATVNT
jgi:hypothetical protein